MNVCMRVMHRRQDYWDDSNDFRPERWLEDPEQGGSRCPAHSYLPFSIEPRICEGKDFAGGSLRRRPGEPDSEAQIGAAVGAAADQDRHRRRAQGRLSRQRHPQVTPTLAAPRGPPHTGPTRAKYAGPGCDPLRWRPRRDSHRTPALRKQAHPRCAETRRQASPRPITKPAPEHARSGEGPGGLPRVAAPQLRRHRLLPHPWREQLRGLLLGGCSKRSSWTTSTSSRRRTR